ncbi:MAG TPA: hypothetical protein VF888_03120 [Nitrospirota bacterium]
MILHPAIIALLTASALTSLMVVYAAYYGFVILRNWDLSSGSELQLGLERRTYLISTILGYVLVFQIASLFLYIYTADSLCTLFTGAMCAVGMLNVNAFGYPTLIFKLVNFLLAGTWLIINYTDNQAYDYPLIKAKYRLLVIIAPLIVAETALLYAYVLGLKPEIITSCCGSLFSRDSAGIAGDIIGLPTAPMMAAFYAGNALTLLSGFYFYRTGKAGYLFSALSGITAVLTVASIFSFLSIYIYELPSHHCPFCLLQKEYHYIGYPLYAALLFGAVSGIGVGALMPFMAVGSLKQVVPALQKRLSLAALFCWLLLTGIATYKILASNLVL